jgi:type IV pilus assembly protein PilM
VFLFDKGGLTGIDIGSYALKVVKIKGKGSNRSLEAVGYSQLNHITLPEGDSKLSETIRNLFNTHRIKTKKVASVLSGGSLTVAHLYIPNMPKKDMKEAVRWEMRKHITFSPEELVCDFTTIGEVKRGEESMLSLIAFGAPKKDVKRLIKILEAALLETVMVDVAPLAMLACFDYNNVWENGVNYSMIDIGDSKSTLVIFKDRKLMFVREISIAGREMTSVVMNKLACSEDVAEKEKIRHGILKPSESASGEGLRVVDATSGVVERLAAEVHRSFDYYQAQFRENSVSKIFLCGGSSRLKGIDDFFANILGIPCFIDDPLRNIKIGSKRFDVSMIKEFSPDLAITVGLAL